MGRYAYNKRKSSNRGYRRRQAVLSYARTAKFNVTKLKDKKINTLWERRAQEIAAAQDDTSPWLISRVNHFADGQNYGGSHTSPQLAKMIKLPGGILWWQDISQLTNDPSDPGDGMDSGLYQVKTIQSRLRFYALGLFPIHVRVAIIKIANSGQYGQTAINPTLVNADINPTWNMIGDTSLRYSGIHSTEMKNTAPGIKTHTVISQKSFTVTPKNWNAIPPQIELTTVASGNTLSVSDPGDGNGLLKTNYHYYGYGFQAVAEKQIILTKTYKNYLKVIQTLNQTAADDDLTAIQNKTKSIGDRFFLCIFADHMQDWSVSPNLPVPADQINKTSSLYFYGTSGCIYNYDKKQTQVSVELPDDQEIKAADYV